MANSLSRFGLNANEIWFYLWVSCDTATRRASKIKKSKGERSKQKSVDEKVYYFMGNWYNEVDNKQLIKCVSTY